MKVRAQHSREETASSPMGENESHIRSLEKQIRELRNLLQKKDDHIVRLTEQIKSASGWLSVRRSFLIKLMSVTAGLLTLTIILFNILPRLSEAETTVNVAGLDETQVTATKQKIEKMIPQYQNRLRFQTDPQNQNLTISFSAATPAKAASLVRDVASAFNQIAFIQPQRDELQQTITRLNAQSDFLEENIQTFQDRLRIARIKQNYQEVSQSLYDTLQNRSPKQYDSIGTELDAITLQQQKIAEGVQSLEHFDILQTLSLERLNRSPVIGKLLHRLKNQEFNRLVHRLDNIRSQAMINERAPTISTLKQDIVSMIKVYLDADLTPQKEAELSLYLVNLFLQVKETAIRQILDQQYLPKDTFDQNTQKIASLQKQLQESKKNLKEINAQRQKFRKRSDQLSANTPMIGLTIPASAQLTFHAKMLYLLFCLLGISLGGIGAIYFSKR